MTSLPPPLHPGRLRTLQRLSWRLVRRTLGPFAGRSLSAWFGTGLDFAQVREYQQGDDVRAIDWNVSARSGRWFVKEFIEERHRNLFFCVDGSRSMRQGLEEDCGYRLALEVLAVFAWIAEGARDGLGAAVFTDRVEFERPIRCGELARKSLLFDLLRFEPCGRTWSLRSSVDHLTGALGRRATVFLISDFLSEESFEASLHRLKRHELILLRVVDRWLQPRFVQELYGCSVRFEDAESGARRTLRCDAELCARVEAMNAQLDRRLVLAAEAAGADLWTLRVGDDPIESLLECLQRRSLRRR